ncbi:hypothetical protein SASPL_107045 [Salvia splendens]|uniref:C2 domain-containing protein n=1 Tax=Salvia splendens TaxID=180675 RepID=A0A8X8YAD3_SALSN|nr:hypothetical protein SASPL_107045 [Salvia splendens]
MTTPSPATNRDDYKIKDTKPQLGERWPHGGVRGGGGWITSDRLTSTYDLVEQTYYLYVRVIKAQNLPPNPVTGNCDPYVEVKLGNYKGKTQHFEKKMSPEWNQVFAFAKEKMQSSSVEVYVRDREMVAKDDYLGKVVFDLNEVPPDSPLSGTASRIEAEVRGEVMLAVWMGTQADEAFPEAWHSDGSSVTGEEGVFSVRSKVYVSPKLWYIRVNVIEAQDVEWEDKSQPSESQVLVKAQVGNQMLKTKICATGGNSPFWKPFEELLVMVVENKTKANKDEAVGRLSLPLGKLDKRLDHRPRHPPHMDAKLSWAEAVIQDKLNEEFDTFPTSKAEAVVRMRYDRLRSVAGRVQTWLCILAEASEELESVIGALKRRIKRSVTKAEASFVDLDEAKKLITVKGGYGVVMFATKLSQGLRSTI